MTLAAAPGAVSPGARRATIAVDAMGGDHGPAVVVAGALAAARQDGARLVLVGDENAIRQELAKHKTSGLDVEVVHASEVAEMGDKPSDVVRRKKDASIVVACRLVKEGKADGVVSAGNSGATLASGMFVLGRAPGVERPALATVMPTERRPMVLIDVGANVDARPRHLHQFGIMAHVFAQSVLGYQEPSVGLLSIGEEEGKGNDQVRRAFELLRASPINFVGNVEGRDIFTGQVDVVVCDGFVGNVALKLSEGLAGSIGRMLKRELTSTFFSRLGALLAIKGFRRFKKLTDYAEYGGAPLLGLKGIVVVCHGSSPAKAIQSAVDMACVFVEKKVHTHLMEQLAPAKDEAGRVYELPPAAQA